MNIKNYCHKATRAPIGTKKINFLYKNLGFSWCLCVLVAKRKDKEG
jgi:hypothetical protein